MTSELVNLTPIDWYSHLASDFRGYDLRAERGRMGVSVLPEDGSVTQAEGLERSESTRTASVKARNSGVRM